MSKKQASRRTAPEIEREPAAAFPAAFGRAFFLTQLAAFVRNCCPEPSEKLPFVHLHLASGEVLELCHVLALSPRWLALAVWNEDAGEGARAMRTELVPYELLVRITIRASRARGTHIGFHQETRPAIHAAPEETLQMAAGQPAPPGGSDGMPR